ncbi:MAG: fused MFS/spermidine synthase [Pseudomonadota bacterium]
MTEITHSAGIRSQTSAAGAAPYVFTIFLSASLIFLVQPMFARMALPVLGGTPAVWNVSLVCFQAALLAGYIYAHLLVKLNNVLHETLIHGAVLLAAALVLPFGLTDALGAPDVSAPTLWLVAVFALSIAPPFAAISATAPLIQSWYSRSGRHDAADPYHLYASSNVGSLIGLVTYPVIMEPLLPVADQTFSWSMGYALLAVALVGCGALAWSTGHNKTLKVPVLDKADKEDSSDTSILWQRLKWLGLAFVPSSLLVGSTTHIATDVASAPFLWAPPLMIYIGSFIVVFSSAGPNALRSATRLLPIAIGLVLLCLNVPARLPISLVIAADLAALALAAIVCHGVMAETRPHASRLTEFYLIMSFGGVLGGAFNALVAPVIFNSAIEYPLILVLALLGCQGALRVNEGRDRTFLIASVGVAVIGLTTLIVKTELPTTVDFALIMVPLFTLLMLRNEKLPAFVAAVSLAVSAHSLFVLKSDEVTLDRSFFGVVKTMVVDDKRIMLHGTTVHGAQALEFEDKPTPITYYHPSTPMGQIFGEWQQAENVAVLGLGVGSVACLVNPNQKVTFLEIDPLVAQLAADPTLFNYLSDCGQNSRVVLGDGRFTLLSDPEGAYNLMLVDAFSSDSIPVHLLTVEAFETYLSRLADDGLLAVHISNRHVDLRPMLGRLAAEMNLSARVRTFYVPNEPEYESVKSSRVVVLGRTEEALGPLVNDERWVGLESDGQRLWTDDYSNLLGAIIHNLRHKEDRRPS